ncbi:vWA domain-containing protein [Flavicella sediminum]|uniref:vWA domain-containing protein n=1 Tax=Flavicella sediminum TaxID=2585141 RepID=UPI0011245D3C|nr:VWA domain-containing protein [Flavicella sediminum]
MKKVAAMIILFVLAIGQLTAKTVTGIVREHLGAPLPGVSVLVEGTSRGTTTDFDGHFQIEIEEGKTLIFNYIGFVTKKLKVGKSEKYTISLMPQMTELEEVVTIGYGSLKKSKMKSSVASVNSLQIRGLSSMEVHETVLDKQDYLYGNYVREGDDEVYESLEENEFKNPLTNPLSTFSIDVDAASYSNMRRFINDGQKPPAAAIRIEEMINYFEYNYPQPKGSDPFSINYEVAACPWNPENKLVHIGLQGKSLETKEAPASNLVFLIDVSGSMRAQNKLPLLKKAYALLVNQLRAKDKIAIVVYAGNSGVVLPSTPGNEKKKILKALNKLQSGGGTAGAKGLKLAYEIAEENFIKDGNNRIILATDGDFNVGQSSNSDLEKLIVSKRDQGIFISVTGFGMGNYKDSKMEIIADKGNGNYSYIDNILEAKKVFINEFSSTLFTIAKDVKIQIEFNPSQVRSYRLIGYENRMLKAQDFQNDKKDAGELGAGHTVTALYEIVPMDAKKKYDTDLKYQKVKKTETKNNFENELATVKFRYKKPNESKSKLLVRTLHNSAKKQQEISENFKFSSAVAGFGMLLKNSDYKENLNYEVVLKMAKEGKGNDAHGYRSEFIRLVELVSLL